MYELCGTLYGKELLHAADTLAQRVTKKNSLNSYTNQAIVLNFQVQEEESMPNCLVMSVLQYDLD